MPKNIQCDQTEFCVPDHGFRTAIMAKFRAFMRNPDLFRTFSRYVHLNCKTNVKDVKNGRKLSNKVLLHL